MRLYRVTANYPRYLEDFSARHPGFDAHSYEVQYNLLMRDGFGWADFLTRNMAPIGWEVWEPVANFEAHQKQWAKEKGFLPPETDWLESIILQQIKYFKPDVVFIDSYSLIKSEFVRKIKAVTSKLKLLIAWCGVPRNNLEDLNLFDIILSCMPSFVERLDKSGCRAIHLPHAFEESVLVNCDTDTARSTDFSFSGSIFPGSANHDKRLELLAYLRKRLPLEVYSDINAVGASDLVFLLRRSKRTDLLTHLRGWRHRRLLCKTMHPPVYGLPMYNLMLKSKMTFNSHIGCSPTEAANTRLFQATGCGTCLLTDWRPDLSRYFKIDEEVVTYRSAAEAYEKARYLLENEMVREQIAGAGRRRTLNDHSFAARCKELDYIIRQCMN